ncbi:MAG: TolC family protein [bacterium]|nr:TolC family protein [bacterium]
MFRIIRTVLFFLGFAILSGPVACPAQESSASEMHLSISECIDMALNNNSQVIQSQYTREIADAQVGNNKRVFFPTISSNYGINRSITGPRAGSTIDPATGQVITTTVGGNRVSGAQSVGASMSIPIYDRSDFANLSASKKGAKAAEQDLNNTQKSIVFQVKQRYFQLLQQTRLLDVQREQVSVSEESFRRNETLYEIGSSAISEMYSAKSQLERDRATLITRENDVAIARSNLGFVMGLDADVQITPAETEFEVTPLPLAYEDALDRALQNHPELVARQFRMQQSKDQLNSTRYSAYYPTINGSARYSWNLGKDEKFSGLNDLFDKNYSYTVNANISIPVFNGPSARNNIKIRKLQYLQSQSQLNQARREKALEVKQAFLNIERLRRSIEANRAAVQASEEDFKLQDQRYTLGGGTFLERQQAQLNLFNARNQLVQAQYNYQIELAGLEQAIGGPIAQTGK